MWSPDMADSFDTTTKPEAVAAANALRAGLVRQPIPLNAGVLKQVPGIRCIRVTSAQLEAIQAHISKQGKLTDAESLHRSAGPDLEHRG